MSREPLTKVGWSQGIHTKEVDWLTRSISKIAPSDKGKKLLVEKVKGNPIKEMVSLIFADLEFTYRTLKSISRTRLGYNNYFGSLFLATNIETVYRFGGHPSAPVIEAIQDAVFRSFQHGQCADQFCEFFEEAAQLRDLVSSISTEKLKSQELLTSFISYLNERMKSIELSVEDLPLSLQKYLFNLRELAMSKRGKVIAATTEKERVAVVTDTETTVGSTDGFKSFSVLSKMF
ncbi:hypothetical protein F511_06796 [Dorcoceras hygrometricum]|uniref:Uncharacterized protein n=1 Tax=Dorcoceras hygrometricum TaxID=472368 RepID=A0A2Z7CPX7_9LAMI|nr:hypothetical protein F511_06796 [Dorcoceras hygrometricum]